MDRERFNKLIGMAGDRMYTLIKHKGVGKYTTEGDALHNFRVIAGKREKTLGEAWQGMADKHEAVVEDMISGAIPITEELIKEHAIDRLTYAALLVPVLYEMMDMQTYEDIKRDHCECDDCSEQGKGYDAAIKVLEDRADHLRNTGAERITTAIDIEELRKERPEGC